MNNFVKALLMLFVAGVVCGCNQPAQIAQQRVRYDQKVQTYQFTDEKSLTAILDSESAEGWIVSASAFDPRSGTLIVFFKKPEGI